MKDILKLLFILFICTFSTAMQAQDIEAGAYSRWGLETNKSFLKELKKKYPSTFAKGKTSIHTLTQLSDKSGEQFYCLVVKFKKKGVVSEMFVTLTDKNGVLWHTAADCIMECTKQGTCPTCDMEITKKCRQLNCGCSDKINSCGSKVTF